MVLVLAAVNVATMVSISPGNLGFYEAAAIELRRESRQPGLFKYIEATTLPHYRVVLVRRPYVYLLRNDLPFGPVEP